MSAIGSINRVSHIKFLSLFLAVVSEFLVGCQSILLNCHSLSRGAQCLWWMKIWGRIITIGAFLKWMKQWIWVSIYTVANAEKSRYNCLQVWGWLAQLQFRIQKVGLHPAPWIIVGSKSSRTWKHTRGPHVTVPMICRSPASLEGYRSFIPTHYWDVKEHWDYDTRNLKFMKKRFGERGAFKDSRAISNSFFFWVR